MNMIQIARTELSEEELDHVVGGMIVPTNESQIVANLKAKDFANGSAFTGTSSFHDGIDGNNNLP
jgi:bacteriocin-like protein